MNKFSVRFALVLLALLLILTAACSNKAAKTGKGSRVAYIPVVSKAQSQEKFSDPFAYCEAMGTIDKPDERYTGEPVTDAIINGYKKAAGLEASTEPMDMFKKTTTWRCMDSKVYACNVGANLPCESKANTDKNPTQAMTDFCQANPKSDFIPMSVTGHDTVYTWYCDKTTPKVKEQVEKVDAQGYIAGIWYLIAPNP